ncbi:glucosamine--fructose-6-phosphate aminotransferase [Clostridia bacterium]|nr:glucosamine--fructose-6-phosphate aminotransferase [Clostridia bacterium]
MYKTEEEIFNQHISLRQTYAYLNGNSAQIKDFFGISGFYSVTFTGCGATYALAKSAELSLKMRGGLMSMSFPAGDLMLNMPYYREMLNGTLMFVSSRSGQTSEVIAAVEKTRREAGALTISICATANSRLSQSSDLNLEMPWIFDESSCASRSISNMYTANLYNIGLLSGDNLLLDEIKTATDNQEDFIKRFSSELEGIGQSDLWDRVLVLADCELGGAAEAGSLAIQRMCKLPSTYCHILDVRHGAVTMVDNRTLVICVVSPLDDAYQSVLLRELAGMGAQIMTISSREDNIYGSALNVTLPSYANYAVRGIPLLFCLQSIGYFKALADGKNPDKGDKVSNWVRI